MHRVTTDDTAGAFLCSCSSPPALRNPEVVSHIKQWGQYSRTCCVCAANSPFIQVFVCCVCAGAHTQHTKTCTTTCGRRGRPACMRILPLPYQKIGWSSAMADFMSFPATRERVL